MRQCINQQPQVSSSVTTNYQFKELCNSRDGNPLPATPGGDPIGGPPDGLAPYPGDAPAPPLPGGPNPRPRARPLALPGGAPRLGGAVARITSSTIMSSSPAAVD